MKRIAQVVLIVLCSLLADPNVLESTEQIMPQPAPAILATVLPLPVKTEEEKVSRSSELTYVDMGNFTITAYTAGVESTGKRPGDKGYGITATGTYVQEGRTISADWRILPKGTRVRIESLSGIYTVEDSGSAVKGHKIDLYISDLGRAKEWGKKTLKVEIVK